MSEIIRIVEDMEILINQLKARLEYLIEEESIVDESIVDESIVDESIVDESIVDESIVDERIEPLKKDSVSQEIYITEDKINRMILTSSKILNCTVKNGDKIISNKKKYRSILNDIWVSMPKQKILQTTTFNMKLTNENGLDGYKWCEKLKLSIQGKDSIYSMKEILNMIKVNNYSIKITIQLVTEEIINFKLNI
jgi:hypothetical protein